MNPKAIAHMIEFRKIIYPGCGMAFIDDDGLFVRPNGTRIDLQVVDKLVHNYAEKLLYGE